MNIDRIVHWRTGDKSTHLSVNFLFILLCSIKIFNTYSPGKVSYGEFFWQDGHSVPFFGVGIVWPREPGSIT